MRKFYVMLVVLGMVQLSLAQAKSTGVINLPSATPMSVKLDANKITGILTMTVTGPADRMFYIGFNGTTMANCLDAVAITKEGACDQLAGTISGGVVTVTQPYIAPGANVLLDLPGFGAGHNIAVRDAVNDWTVISDDGDLSNAALTLRTVVATRKLISDNPSQDYNFDYDNLSTLNIIWAEGRDFAPNTTAGVLVNPDSPDNGYWALSGKNTVGVSTRHNNAASLTRGASVLTFTQNEIKTTGLVTITPATALYPITTELDMDNTTGLLYMTITGPADRMFYLGFGSTTMTGGTDAVAITKEGACDQLAGTISSNVVTVTQPYIAPGANAVLDTKGFISHAATTKDAGTNDWKVISDDGDLSNTALTTRTVIASRPLNTGNTTEDYTFDFTNLTTLNVIWAEGRDFVPNTAAGVLTNPNSPDNGYWSLSGKITVGISTRHSGAYNGTTTLFDTRGTSVLTFGTVLGVEPIATLDKIAVYPNPSKNIFNISANTTISKIRIFDTSAKLLKEVNTDTHNQNISIDLSELSNGMYFMEISNNGDKVVKKIMKN